MYLSRLICTLPLTFKVYLPLSSCVSGHVTSGKTCTAYSQVGLGESLLLASSCHLPIRQSHGGPRLDSCSMGLAILSALVYT